MSTKITLLDPDLAAISAAMNANGFPTDLADEAARRAMTFMQGVYDTSTVLRARVSPLQNVSRLLIERGKSGEYCELIPRADGDTVVFTLQFGKDRRRYSRKLPD